MDINEFDGDKEISLLPVVSPRGSHFLVDQ